MPDPSRDGAYAEYIVVRESELALKPKSLHHVHAAAVPLAALTAWQALFDAGQLEPGQRVLIHGGSGGVGHVAVQLAKWKGAHVLATASTKNQELLRELGVDEPIDYTKQKFEDVARDVDLVLDLIGGETQERSWSVLKKGGVLLSLVQPPSVEKAKALGVRAAFVAGHPSGAQLAEIAKLIDSGELKPTIDRILPLSEVRRAHELSQIWSHPRQNCPANQQRKWNDGKETVMIRGFKSSRIREEFANFSEHSRRARNTVMQLFSLVERSLRTPLASRKLRLPFNETERKLMKPIPGTLQEGGAAFQTTHWTLVLRAGQSDPTETAAEGAVQFLRSVLAAALCLSATSRTRFT